MAYSWPLDLLCPSSATLLCSSHPCLPHLFISHCLHRWCLLASFLCSVVIGGRASSVRVSSARKSANATSKLNDLPLEASCTLFKSSRILSDESTHNCSKDMQIVNNSTPVENLKKCHSTLYAARIQDDCLPLEARSLIGSSGIPGYVACWFAEAPLSQKRIESWTPCLLEIIDKYP